MPFIVSHTPDLAALGSVAYQTGLAIHQQRIEDQNRQEQNQRRAMYANLVSQAMAQRAAMERQRLDDGFQREAVARNQNFQLRLGQLQQDAIQGRHDEEMAMRKAEAMWNRQQGAELMQNRNQQVAGELLDQEHLIAKNVTDLQEKGFSFRDGGQAYQAYQERRTRILGDKTLRPLQRAQALRELAASIPMPDVPPSPEPDEIAKNQVVHVDDPNRPGIKIPLVVQRSKNGDMLAAPLSGYKPPDMNAVSPSPVRERILNDPAMLLKYRESFVKSLTKKGLNGEPDVVPSDQEVSAAMSRFLDSVSGSTPGASKPTADTASRLELHIPLPEGEQQVIHPRPHPHDTLVVGRVYGPTRDPKDGRMKLFQWTGEQFLSVKAKSRDGRVIKGDTLESISSQ